MLAKRPHNKPAFLTAPGILEQPVHQSLLCFAATLTLAVCNFDQVLIHTFDGERFRFPQGKALLLLGFEGHITSVAMFVIDSLERLVVESADLPQSL